MPITSQLDLRTTRRIAGRSVLALAIVVVCTGNLTAQRRAQIRAGFGDGAGFQLPSAVGQEAPPLRQALRGGERPTHWKAGLIIGTLVGALAIYHVGIPGIDSFTPRVALGLVLFGGLVGGVPGALIGDQFPKGPPDAGAMSLAR